MPFPNFWIIGNKLHNKYENCSVQKYCNTVYSFSIAGMTNYHEFSNLKQQFLFHSLYISSPIDLSRFSPLYFHKTETKVLTSLGLVVKLWEG